MTRAKRAKQKLIVTVDLEVLIAAKPHARSRGVSLSALIEHALRNATVIAEPPFSARWKGRFRAASRDDSHYEALARKHLGS